MTTVEDRLRDAAASLRPPSSAIPPFARVRRRVRRRRVMMAATVVVVAAAVSGAIATTAGRARVVVTTPVSTSSSVRPPTHATAPVGPPTPVPRPAPSTVSTADSFTVVSGRLESYVAAEQARDSAAGTSSLANIWGDPVLAEQSTPVLEEGTYLAVVALSFDPGGRPVEVLAYANHTWSRLATLAAPTAPGTIVHAGALDLVAEQPPIPAADVTGDGRPDFLITFAGGGCFSAAVVSQAGRPTGWRYVPFTGPLPTSEVLGGNPRFDGRAVMSDNDCTAVSLPAAQRHTFAWTYEPSPASFVGIEEPG